MSWTNRFNDPHRIHRAPKVGRVPGYSTLDWTFPSSVDGMNLVVATGLLDQAQAMCANEPASAGHQKAFHGT
jgi:hypothetical protein